MIDPSISTYSSTKYGSSWKVHLEYVATKDQIADIFTKPLPEEKRFREVLGP
jgi:hypothetical protein